MSIIKVIKENSTSENTNTIFNVFRSCAEQIEGINQNLSHDFV